MSIHIVGLHLDHRAKTAPRVQEVLTGYGSNIHARFGIPEPNKEDGLITLIMEAEGETVQSLSQDLSEIQGVTVKSLCMC